MRCPVCYGNDGDLPCAAPGENRPGCLRDERLARRRCEGCGNEIDPDTCGCGSPIAHLFDGHSPIPMGCDCGRVSREGRSE